jgi:spoIIIJ-associated protein
MSDDQPRPDWRSARRERPRAEAQLDRERVVEGLKCFLEIALRELHLDVQYEIRSTASEGDDEANITVALGGAEEDLLLERNAELLLALEHIAHRWVRLDPRLHDRVQLDCADYRAVHLEELKLSARVAAQRARETGQPFRFNPMSPRDRRIIHLELNGAPNVRTVSEGIGDRRQLVIYPDARKA